MRLDPENTIVAVKKRSGENFWYTQDIINKVLMTLGMKLLRSVLIGGGKITITRHCL